VSEPTQVARPWRSTVRTVFVMMLALLSLLPIVVVTGGIGAVHGVSQVLTVAAALQRVLVLPQVEDFLERFVFTSWLAAAPKEE
jgi:hypothetical protein